MRELKGRQFRRAAAGIATVLASCLALEAPALAFSSRPDLNLLSCVASTDERLAECGVRGFEIADSDRLEGVVGEASVRGRRAHRPWPFRFWAGVKSFPRLLGRGLRNFIVPKARVVLCRPQTDWADRYAESAPEGSLSHYRVNHAWAFQKANMHFADSSARAWQRGYGKVNDIVALTPDLRTDRYGLSLDIRF